jgi:hypothetical protein
MLNQLPAYADELTQEKVTRLAILMLQLSEQM